MKNFEKYERQYFMPPEVTYDWVKKEYIKEPPSGAAWTCGTGIRH